MSIGRNLRKLRTAKRMSLKELAEASEVSIALLSQIERGLTDPSVNTLRKIADVLHVTVAFFFGDSEDSAFVVRKDRRRMLRMGHGVTYYLLSAKTAPNLEVLYGVFDVGSTTGEEPHLHLGEECAVILEGTLHIELGGNLYVLEESDAISFSSTIPHRISNGGAVPARAIWIDTPPQF